jgi:uncharacterized protein (DUF983 family)
MPAQQSNPLPVSLPDTGAIRFLVAAGRGLRRHCPYCGGDKVYKDFFNLKERCPHCNTLFAYEDGYFLGGYAINVIVMMFLGVAIVIGLITLTDLSVLQMQILGVVIAVGLPILFYPPSLLIWVAVDVAVNPPGDFSKRPRH